MWGKVGDPKAKPSKWSFQIGHLFSKIWFFSTMLIEDTQNLKEFLLKGFIHLSPAHYKLKYFFPNITPYKLQNEAHP